MKSSLRWNCWIGPGPGGRNCQDQHPLPQQLRGVLTDGAVIPLGGSPRDVDTNSYAAVASV
ncbi:hypothetical protein, partial [Rhodococcus erythropolis]|uniref:hypothetical protein n=1 Tax=Rhodococcus erythropolis TaxID=1833 RepID=UPI001AD9BE5E